MTTVDKSYSQEKSLQHVNLALIASILLNVVMVILLRLLGSQMYPFFILLYAWIAMYTFFLFVLLKRDRMTDAILIRSPFSIGLLALLTISVRLIFLGISEYISLDPLWYLDYGKFMQMGKIPYADFYFPYPPVFAYFILLIGNTYPSVESYRLLAAVLDAAIVVVLWRLIQYHAGPRWASIAAFAYALLPISIIESGWNGHFEPLANLLMLLGLWLFFQGRDRLSAISIGLATATKIYPIVVAPFLLIRHKTWEKRVEFAALIAIAAGLPYATFVIPMLFRGTSGSPIVEPSLGATDFISSILQTIISPNIPLTVVRIYVIAGIAFGAFVLIKQTLKDNPKENNSAYHWTWLLLGVVLITMGAIAALYPLSPLAIMVYWRYPADVGIVRGVTAICVGILIIAATRESWKVNRGQSISLDSLFLLILGAILVLLSLSTGVFYGWYLLWSLPFFLMLRNRQLGLMVVLCLLLIYPSYTHDNFESLGFEENRLWSEEFGSVDGWICHTNFSDSGIDPDLILAGIDTDGERGRFWFDTSRLPNRSILGNLSISFTRPVLIDFDASTEFAARIASSWDPTFGHIAGLSLQFLGINEIMQSVIGYIIPKTQLFTNLTYILWRYAFSSHSSQLISGHIENLTLTIYPSRLGVSAYYVDYLYTTHTGLLNPIYFLVVPTLIAMALTSYALLHEELRESIGMSSEMT